MARKHPREVRRVACIGAGPIGGGWTAHFLARGYDVTTYLYDAAEEASLHRLIDVAWTSLEAIGLADGASRDRLRCTTDLAEAVAEAEFVQESVPEDLALKQAVYAELGTLVAADVVIASSTSGLSMSEIQAHCPTPERTVVAHPFNPPYLMALVEIVGGEKTSPEAIAWAADFYRVGGKAPLVMEKEVPGFVATRLQEALWREALHMVAAGEATVEQIDMAVVNGPGPRWAFMGPCMTFHVGGGEPLIDKTYFLNGLPIPPDFHGGAENFRSVDYMAIPGPPMQTLATMIFDGVLDRFGELRIGVIEQGAIWVPSWMRQMDAAFEAFRRHEERLQNLSLRPSEYVTRQIRATPYPTEDVGWITDQVGHDICLFSSDYPHVEGGRKPIERFEASLDDASESVRDAFYCNNFLDLMGSQAP